MQRPFRKSRGLSDAHIPASGGPEEDSILRSWVLFTNLCPTFLTPCSPDHFLILGDNPFDGHLDCLYSLWTPHLGGQHTEKALDLVGQSVTVGSWMYRTLKSPLTSNQCFCQNIISSSFRVVVMLRCVAQRFPQGTVCRPVQRQLLTPCVLASAAGSFVT